MMSLTRNAEVSEVLGIIHLRKRVSSLHREGACLLEGAAAEGGADVQENSITNDCTLSPPLNNLGLTQPGEGCSW